MAEHFDLPSTIAILPFRNKVLLPGAVIGIRCTSAADVRLVERELWQKKDLEGLIGVVPMHDSQASEQPLSPRVSGLQSIPEGTATGGGGRESSGAARVPSDLQPPLDQPTGAGERILWHPRYLLFPEFLSQTFLWGSEV
jgi:hypothetical protein